MRLGILYLALCLVLAACDTAASTPLTPSPDSSSQPQPMEPVATSLPGMGTVKGVLIDIADGKPIAERQVLLALIHPGDQLSVAAIDPNSPLKFDTDAAGRFVITNVPPQKYALGMFIPTGYVLIIDGSTKKEKVFTVAAGEIVDIGQMVIDPVVRMR